MDPRHIWTEPIPQRKKKPLGWAPPNRAVLHGQFGTGQDSTAAWDPEAWGTIPTWEPPRSPWLLGQQQQNWMPPETHVNIPAPLPAMQAPPVPQMPDVVDPVQEDQIRILSGPDADNPTVAAQAQERQNTLILPQEDETPTADDITFPGTTPSTETSQAITLPGGGPSPSGAGARPDTGDEVTDAALTAGVDPVLYQRLVGQESGGDQSAVSPKGAAGAAQLMPATAKYLEQKYGLDASTRAGNLTAGAYYFREQLDRFGSVPLALAAYNAGPGAVTTYGGIPPYRETQEYVRRIGGGYEGSGFAPPQGAGPRGTGKELRTGHEADAYEIKFGFNQPYGKAQFNPNIPRHRGVDLVVKGAEDNGRGSPVGAFQGGVVAALTRDPNGGNGVIIQMPNGLYNRYFHFDAVNVAQGQRIAAGEPIGILGATGTEGFPHVHFEVSRAINGDPMDALIDPTPYMTADSNLVGEGQDSPFDPVTTSEWWEDIKSAAKEYDVDPRVLGRQLYQESLLNAGEMPKPGNRARGIGQFEPELAGETASSLGMSLQDFWSAPKNQIRGAAYNLRHNLDTYEGDYERSLAAYNAGPGNVQKYGGVPPFPVTQGYLESILRSGVDRGTQKMPAWTGPPPGQYVWESASVPDPARTPIPLQSDWSNELGEGQGGVEVAATPAQRAQGLLGRTDAGNGMLITDSDQVHMQGMTFPIRAVYMSADGQVLANPILQPGETGPKIEGAAHVLELPVESVGTGQDIQRDRWWEDQQPEPMVIPVQKLNGDPAEPMVIPVSGPQPGDFPDTPPPAPTYYPGSEPPPPDRGWPGQVSDAAQGAAQQVGNIVQQSTQGLSDAASNAATEVQRRLNAPPGAMAEEAAGPILADINRKVEEADTDRPRRRELQQKLEASNLPEAAKIAIRGMDNVEEATAYLNALLTGAAYSGIRDVAIKPALQAVGLEHHVNLPVVGEVGTADLAAGFIPGLNALGGASRVGGPGVPVIAPSETVLGRPVAAAARGVADVVRGPPSGVVHASYEHPSRIELPGEQPPAQRPAIYGPQGEVLVPESAPLSESGNVPGFGVSEGQTPGALQRLQAASTADKEFARVPQAETLRTGIALGLDKDGIALLQREVLEPGYTKQGARDAIAARLRAHGAADTMERLQGDVDHLRARLDAGDTVDSIPLLEKLDLAERTLQAAADSAAIDIKVGRRMGEAAGRTLNSFKIQFHVEQARELADRAERQATAAAKEAAPILEDARKGLLPNPRRLQQLSEAADKIEAGGDPTAATAVQKRLSPSAPTPPVAPSLAQRIGDVERARGEMRGAPVEALGRMERQRNALLDEAEDAALKRAQEMKVKVGRELSPDEIDRAVSEALGAPTIAKANREALIAEGKVPPPSTVQQMVQEIRNRERMAIQDQQKVALYWADIARQFPDELGYREAFDKALMELSTSGKAGQDAAGRLRASFRDRLGNDYDKFMEQVQQRNVTQTTRDMASYERHFDQLRVRELVGQIRDFVKMTRDNPYALGTGPNAWGESRLTSLLDDLAQVSAQGQERASGLRRALYKAGVTRLKGKVQDSQLDAVIKALGRVQTPEQMGVLVRALRQPRLLDYLYEVQFINLLSRPTTHLQNLGMNAANLGGRLIFNELEVFGDAFVTGRGHRVTAQAEIGAAFRGAGEAFRPSLKEAGQVMRTGESPRATQSAIELGTLTGMNREYLTEQFGKPAAIFHAISSRPLEAGDALLGGMAYGSAVEQYATRKANALLKSGGDIHVTKGMTLPEATSQVKANIWDYPDVVEQAGKVRNYTLLRGINRENPVENWLTQGAGFRNPPPGASVGRQAFAFLVNQVLPFYGVPLNWAKQGLDRTLPVGSAWGMFTAKTAEGLPDYAARADAFKRATVGAVTMGLAVSLVAGDNLTGDGPEDPDQNAQWRSDHKPNSWRIPGTGPNGWMSYMGAPWGLPFAVVAYAKDQTQRAQTAAGVRGLSGGEVAAQGAFGIVKGAFKGIMGQTFLQNMAQTYEGLTGNGLGNFIPTMASGTLSRFISPGIVSWFARVSDDMERDATHGDTMLEQISQRLMQNYPLTRQMLPPRQRVLGDPQPNQTYGLLDTPGQDFVPSPRAVLPLPFQMQSGSDAENPIIQAYTNAGVTIGGPPKSLTLSGQRINLTATEQRAFRVDQGKIIRQQLGGVDPATVDRKRLRDVLDLARELASDDLMANLSPAELKKRMLATLPPDNGSQSGRRQAIEMLVDLNDKSKHPEFVEPDGKTPIGMPSDWVKWKALMLIESKKPEDRRAPWYQGMTDSHKRADVAKLVNAWSDPRYDDYERYVVGQLGNNMTPEQWDAFQSGGTPKYLVAGTGPKEWRGMDQIIKLYRTLPTSSPVKAQLRPKAQLYLRAANPKWRGPLEYDELTGRQETGELKALDEMYLQGVQP